MMQGCAYLALDIVRLEVPSWPVSAGFFSNLKLCFVMQPYRSVLIYVYVIMSRQIKQAALIYIATGPIVQRVIHVQPTF